MGTLGLNRSDNDVPVLEIVGCQTELLLSIR